MGKGIFLPLEFLIRHYHRILWDATTQTDDLLDNPCETIQTLSDHMKALYGDDIELIDVGHDALDQDYQALKYVDDYCNALKHIRSLGKTDKLVFIGQYVEMNGSEMGWGVTKPELLYSLPVFLPKLVEWYPRLDVLNLEFLQTVFGQKPLIWTFAGDCCCCT